MTDTYAQTVLRPPTKPCGSCPYRCDVPSGIWHPEEYEKLPAYDGPTWAQSPALFMCHQRDGALCGGWLACHDPGQLLAVRLGLMRGEIDADTLDYRTNVPVFGSGAEARDHGLADIEEPRPRAQKMIDGLSRRLAPSPHARPEDR